MLNVSDIRDELLLGDAREGRAKKARRAAIMGKRMSGVLGGYGIGPGKVVVCH